MDHNTIKAFLSVLAALASLVRADMFVVGGVVRYILFGGEFPVDIDVVFEASANTDLPALLSPQLKLLKLTGVVEMRKVGDRNLDDIYELDSRMTLYQLLFTVKQQTFKVDIICVPSGCERPMDFIANGLMLKCPKIEGNYSIRFAKKDEDDDVSLIDAIRDAREKVLTRPTFHNGCSITIIKRVAKYVQRGWKINPADTFLVGCFPAKNPEWKPDDVCPISREPLTECEWIFQTPCQHLFDGPTFVEFLKRKNIYKCPCCRKHQDLMGNRNIQHPPVYDVLNDD